MPPNFRRLSKPLSGVCQIKAGFMLEISSRMLAFDSLGPWEV